MARLPTPGSDNGTWGDILNNFLLVEHAANGKLKNNFIKTINSSSADSTGNINLPQDGSVSTPSLRTLGIGAQQAASGDHTHSGGLAVTSTQEPKAIRVASSVGTSTEAARADHAHAGLIQAVFRPGAYTALVPVTSSTTTMGNGNLYLYPVYIPRSVTLDRIGVHMTTIADSGQFRFIVYSDDGTGFPGNLFADLGGNAATANAEHVISQPLDAGIYWFGIVLQNYSGTIQPTVRSATTANITPASDTPPIGGASVSCYFVGSITGTPPSPFPASYSATAHSPRIYVRVAN